MKVYAIGGLGADERILKKLELDFPIHILHWIEPKPSETLENYAFRLSEQIDLKEEFVVIGVSFGGMLTIALHRKIQPIRTILVSSAKNRYELPLLYRLLGKTKLFQLIPHTWMRLPKCFAVWLFGAENQSLLSEIIKDTDLKFLKWALTAITRWDEKTIYPSVFRIHGTKDKIIPYRKSNDVIPIRNAGHFMVVDRAEEISSILNKLIHYSYPYTQPKY